jgi:hypothetical protein
MAKEYSIPISGETGGYPCTIINDIFVVKRGCDGMSVVAPRAFFFKLQI